MVDTMQNLKSAPLESDRNLLIGEFTEFISDRAFPCVGAKSALNRGRISFAVCKELGTVASAHALCSGLSMFSSAYPDPREEPVSFAAIFETFTGNEDEFHLRLWRQLQLIHDLDAVSYPWAPGVSNEPASNEFSFSVAGRAYFVVGLHPKSSRLARRAPRPTLVFNFHEQFETMRASGRYEKMQDAIRRRDMELQGSINPVLAKFGAGSEAQQYSGKYGGGCPFSARKVTA